MPSSSELPPPTSQSGPLDPSTITRPTLEFKLPTVLTPSNKLTPDHHTNLPSNNGEKLKHKLNNKITLMRLLERSSRTKPSITLRISLELPQRPLLLHQKLKLLQSSHHLPFTNIEREMPMMPIQNLPLHMMIWSNT